MKLHNTFCGEPEFDLWIENRFYWYLQLNDKSINRTTELKSSVWISVYIQLSISSNQWRISSNQLWIYTERSLINLWRYIVDLLMEIRIRYIMAIHSSLYEDLWINYELSDILQWITEIHYWRRIGALWRYTYEDEPWIFSVAATALQLQQIAMFLHIYAGDWGHQ